MKKTIFLLVIFILVSVSSFVFAESEKTTSPLDFSNIEESLKWGITADEVREIIKPLEGDIFRCNEKNFDDLANLPTIGCTQFFHDKSQIQYYFMFGISLYKLQNINVTVMYRAEEKKTLAEEKIQEIQDVFELETLPEDPETVARESKLLSFDHLESRFSDESLYILTGYYPTENEYAVVQLDIWDKPIYDSITWN